MISKFENKKRKSPKIFILWLIQTRLIKKQSLKSHACGPLKLKEVTYSSISIPIQRTNGWAVMPIECSQLPLSESVPGTVSIQELRDLYNFTGALTLYLLELLRQR